MIGFRFIFEARLLIAETVNNESYGLATDIRFKINYRAVIHYNGSIFKINPLSLLNLLQSLISVRLNGW